jgi:hypothetical protein
MPYLADIPGRQGPACGAVCKHDKVTDLERRLIVDADSVGSPSHLVWVEPSTHLPVVKGDLVRVTSPVVGRDLATPAIHHYVFPHPDAAICEEDENENARRRER